MGSRLLLVVVLLLDRLYFIRGGNAGIAVHAPSAPLPPVACASVGPGALLSSAPFAPCEDSARAAPDDENDEDTAPSSRSASLLAMPLLAPPLGTLVFTGATALPCDFDMVTGSFDRDMDADTDADGDALFAL